MNKVAQYLIGSWLLAVCLQTGAAEFYASPQGKPSGNGSISSPWDLQTALNHPASVRPGDTIWLRGGVYTASDGEWIVFKSKLNGGYNNPITVRQYPGERAAIEGALFQFTGGWVNYWGFEIRNSYPSRTTSQYGPWPTAFQVYLPNGRGLEMCVSGVDLRAPNVKLINLVIHDNIGGGFGVNTEAVNAEVYGCLSYYNGWQGGDRAHGHGIYAQSADPGRATISESIFYGNYALGFQASGSGDKPTTDNFTLQNNILFLNGILARSHQQNMLLGAYAGASKNPVITGNVVFDTMGSSSDSFIGYSGGMVNAIVTGNYFGTSAMFTSYRPGMTLTGNKFLGGTLMLDKAAYPNNDYSTARPTSNVIKVSPNKYEAGRANISVFNWQNLPSVSVSLASFLPVGAKYEIRNAQNFFGPPVASGTYDGGAVTLPMSGLSVAKPAGAAAPASTAPTFNAFVVLPTSTVTQPPPTANTAPTISTIGSQTLAENTTSSAIGFTVGDAQTAADSLSVSATASNPALFPAGSLTLGGSGANRTLTLKPATGQYGSSTITVTVSDGSLQAQTSFSTTVTHANVAPQISTIPAVTLPNSTRSSALPFTVSDLETAAGSLTVTAASSSTAVVPASGLALGGSGANRTITVTPAAGVSGNSTITLRVSDGVASATSSFVVTVLAVANTAPTISAIPGKTIDQDTSTGPIPFTVGDGQTPAGSLSVAVNSSNPGLLPLGNIILGGSGANRTVTLTPAAGQTGSVNVTLTVSDGQATAATTFALTVNAKTSTPPASGGEVAMFSFDESAGKTFADSSANKYTATLTTAYYYKAQPAHVAGKIGAYALYLNGPDSFGYGLGDYLSVSPTSVLDVGANSFTLGLWINTASATDMVLINKYSPAGRESGYALLLDGRSNGGKLRLRISDGNNNMGSTGARTFTGERKVNDGQWHHVAVTVDRDSQVTSFYVDGALDTSVPGANSGNLNVATAFTVGRALGQQGGWYLGTVDDLRVYSRSLAASEIASLAGGTPPTEPPTDPIPDPVPDPTPDPEPEPVNLAPTISTVAAVTLEANTSSGSLGFTVGDSETAAGNLTVTASSANPTVIANTGIVLGNAGVSRTVTVTPVTGASGTAEITLMVSDGEATASSKFIVTVTTPPPPPPAPSNITLEAESGTIIPPMVIARDNAAGVDYICASSANYGSASLALNVPKTGTYYVWVRLLATNWTSDSVTVRMDNGAEDVFDMAEGHQSPNWQWVLLNGRNGTGTPLALNPRTFNLSAGAHTLVFTAREAYAGIDKVVLTQDAAYDPATAVQVRSLRKLGGAAPVSTTPSGRLSISVTSDEVTLRFQGSPDAHYSIEASADQKNWESIGSATADATGAAQFSEKAATGTARFYRVVAP